MRCDKAKWIVSEVAYDYYSHVGVRKGFKVYIGRKIGAHPNILVLYDGANEMEIGNKIVNTDLRGDSVCELLLSYAKLIDDIWLQFAQIATDWELYYKRSKDVDIFKMVLEYVKFMHKDSEPSLKRTKKSFQEAASYILKKYQFHKEKCPERIERPDEIFVRIAFQDIVPVSVPDFYDFGMFVPCSELDSMRRAIKQAKERYLDNIREAEEAGKSMLVKLAKGEISPKQFDGS